MQVVHGIWPLPPSDTGGGGDSKVVVIQTFHEKGSLRDYIYQDSPHDGDKVEEGEDACIHLEQNKAQG